MKANAGHTLLELLTGVVVMGVFLGAVGMLTVQSSNTYREGRAASRIEDSLHEGLMEIANTLADAGRAQLVPEPVPAVGCFNLAFRNPSGFVDDEVQWGPLERIRFEREAGELDDGLDNNGNGLVDEGVVVWLRNAGTIDEQRVVLAKGVRELDPGEIENGIDDDGDGMIDERGLTFSIVGDVLEIELTTEGFDAQGRLRTATVSTSVLIRN